MNQNDTTNTRTRTMPQPPLPPERAAQLRAAFAEHINNILPHHPERRFREWHKENIDLLERVAAVARNPDALTTDLVHELVFPDRNGICALDRGNLRYQIGHRRPMPTVDAFVEPVSNLLRIRNAGRNLSRNEYHDFRKRFFRAAGMGLRAAANRVVVAVFPDQFTTPVPDDRMVEAQRALARRGFVPFPASDVSWFDSASLVVRELRAVLNGNGFDDAYLSSFVWFAPEYFSVQG